MAAWSRNKVSALARIAELSRLQLAVRVFVVAGVLVLVVPLLWAVLVVAAMSAVLWTLWEIARRLVGRDAT